MYANCFAHIAEVEIASEAYIYFYPILNDMAAAYYFGIWPHGSEYSIMNIFRHVYIIDWTNSSASDPIMDTLYSQAYLDLENPLVLNIPAIPQKVLCTRRKKKVEYGLPACTSLLKCLGG